MTTRAEWENLYPGLTYPLDINNSGLRYDYSVTYDPNTQTASYTCEVVHWVCASGQHSGHNGLFECSLQLKIRNLTPSGGVLFPLVSEGGIALASPVQTTTYGPFSLPYTTIVPVGALSFVPEFVLCSDGSLSAQDYVSDLFVTDLRAYENSQVSESGLSWSDYYTFYQSWCRAQVFYVPEDPGGGGGAEPVLGCMDPTATNYNADATQDDGSCTYPVALLVCDDGPILLEDSPVTPTEAENLGYTMISSTAVIIA